MNCAIPFSRRAWLATLFFVASGGARAQPARTAPPPPPAKPTAPQSVIAESDVAKLPPRVADMRERILDAAKSGDIEKLRIPLERNETPPVLARGGKGDLIALLRGKSFDAEGREAMARLINLMEAPYARINPGKPQEMFVWPAYAEMMWDQLKPEDWIGLYRVIPAGVIKESLEKRRYVGDRIGIGPDGTWHYFLTGE
ncbi:hypothetical protein [Terrarubrum flagellatum]|uniref:hypothetical protein n=1 Tax=Terrirubrum flagellatum TaxID=2895980 RepID=UPI0031456682